jgi:hypothetical protein
VGESKLERLLAANRRCKLSHTPIALYLNKMSPRQRYQVRGPVLFHVYRAKYLRELAQPSPPKVNLEERVARGAKISGKEQIGLVFT